MAIKHALVLLFLVVVWYFELHGQFEVVQKKIEAYHTNVPLDTRQSNMELGISVYKLIATLSGLLLAGAISGFFHFKYARCRDTDGRCSPRLLFLGDLMTGLQLVVIGILLTIVVESIDRCEFTKPLFSIFVLLGVVLYLALVLYDIYDYRCQNTEE
jgi:hypothetical protein